MKKYIPSEIEPKWQDRWTREGIYASGKTLPNKHYVLAEFAYPSGDLHMGHWFTFGGADIYARFKRMQGFQVFFPNGFDAFGLPAENAAIKRGIHPQDWTMSNIAQMKKQFATMGGSFSFDHEVVTCLPEFYKWNQWIFLRMLERGLAYRGKTLSNWCEVCQTVLANEAVEAGRCWRCGTEVVQKEVEQWFFKITEYADRLLWPQAEGPERSRGVDWPQPVREGQNNWIGRSEGAVIQFKVQSSKFKVEVFTTRADTVFGATFLVLAPEHLVVTELLSSKFKVQSSKFEEIRSYVDQVKKKSELERKENKEKSGVFSGLYAINPLTEEKIPVWIADYVLPGYGTGAVMAVPAHDQRDFEFARKYDLQIKKVISEESQKSKVKSQNYNLKVKSEESDKAYEGEGVLVNSGEFTGLKSDVARSKITDHITKQNIGSAQVQYHLRDWSVSRQRYWGTPVPIIYCDPPAGGCGMVPVPDEDLPVELPYDVDYTPKGKAPLASNETWLEVKCPKCGGEAKRDPETLDTFVDSAWYFFRYLSPKLDTAPFDADAAKRIMPVDIYFGGAEHTLGHTLYSRFLTKFFKDLGLVDFEEYALKRVNHGIVLGPDGRRMSKSRGNVVNPDEEVKKYGADAVRVYLAFFMPYEWTGPWISERIWGPYRFLERVWGLYDKVQSSKFKVQNEDLKIMHRTIRKVTEDIGSIKFNTAVAALMEWLNYLSKKETVSQEEYRTMLLLLAPFAPHLAEELWSVVGEEYSIHQQPWPQYNVSLLEEAEVRVVVTVDGKVRDQLVIQKDIASDREAVEKMATQAGKVQRFLDGRKIKKVVYVPVKIVNIVTEPI